MLKTDRLLEMPKVAKKPNTIYFKGSHSTVPDSSCVLKNYINSIKVHINYMYFSPLKVSYELRG